MGEKIWFRDLRNFFNENNFDRFFPSASMTYEEKLNSIMRLSIYFTGILLVLKKDANVFFIPVLVGIFTYFLYQGEARKKRNEEYFLSQMNLYKDPKTRDLCYKPTPNNPFMNILMSDYTQQPKRAKACNISKNPIKRQAQQYFNRNLYRDVSDIYQKNASDRNFYTTPITTIPNAQDDFLKFAYQIGKTCKEGGSVACEKGNFRTILQ
jgi:hypothetical protein